MKALMISSLLIAFATVANAGINGDLIQAAWKGNTNEVESLIAQGADVNAIGSYDETVLMRTAEVGDVKMLALLVKNGANVNIQNSKGHSALMRAVNSGRVEATKFLVDNAAYINATSHYGTTVLMYAATDGNLAIIKLLIEQGADVTAQNKGGETAIQFAASAGNTVAAAQLLQNFIKIPKPVLPQAASKANVPTSKPTPAAKKNTIRRVRNYSKELYGISDESSSQIGLVQQLLQKKANPNIIFEGDSAMHLAAENPWTPLILQALIQAGGDCNIRDEDTTTPLHRATKAGLLEHVQLLLQCRADPNARASPRFYDNIAPLHFLPKLEIMQALLAAGAQADIKNGKGMTPLMMIVSNEGIVSDRGKAVATLLKAGANPNQKNAEGKTALHVAVEVDRNGSENMDRVVAALLAGKADPCIKDPESYIPYHKASPGTYIHHSLGMADGHDHACSGDGILSEGENEWMSADDSSSKTTSASKSLLDSIEVTKHDEKQLADPEVEETHHIGVSEKSLHEAVEGGNLAIVERLLANGADVNAKNEFGETALMYAVTFEHPEIAKKLLEYNADLDIKSNNGNTALGLANTFGYIKMAELLRQYGAKG